MTYTTHGHHIDGTIDLGEKPDRVARCGGPGLCGQCSTEAAMATKDSKLTVLPGVEMIWGTISANGEYTPHGLSDEELRFHSIRMAVHWTAELSSGSTSDLCTMADHIGTYIRTGKHPEAG